MSDKHTMPYLVQLEQEVRELKELNEHLRGKTVQLNDRIKRLELAGHHLSCWLDRNTPIGVRNDWLKAKDPTL